MPLDDLLRRNRAWAAVQLEADPQFFARQVAGQQPRLLWIGCSDSRVPAEQILDCGPGELFIHRNVANIVANNDINIAAVVQFATEQLNVPDIVVCGHYGCGGVEAACADKAMRGYVGDWLFIVDPARREVEARLAQSGETVSRKSFCVWWWKRTSVSRSTTCGASACCGSAGAGRPTFLGCTAGSTTSPAG